MKNDAFGLSVVISNTYAENIYQIKTSLGTLSLAKKSLKEDDTIWTLKIEKKVLREIEMQGNGPYFMSELGDSAAKPTLIDSEGEVMATCC